MSLLPRTRFAARGPNRFMSFAQRVTCFAFLTALIGASDGYAQDARRHELGLRYWLSTGDTSWNHTAGEPALGSPTSVLTYDRLEGHSAELYFRRYFRETWFVRGNAGLGTIRKGSFDDEDFAARQVKFSETTSPVEGASLRYATLDFGKVLLEGSARRPELHAFAGYQYWSERYDAYGLTYRVNFFGNPDQGTNVPVISNETRWHSLRAGLGARFGGGPYTFSLDVAYVPYTDLHNRDFHYLRSDLGGVPNVFMNGSGTGWQLDAEVRRALTKNLDVGLGLRYWTLRADGTVTLGGSEPLALNEFQSRRAGITATLGWRY